MEERNYERLLNNMLQEIDDSGIESDGNESTDGLPRRRLDIMIGAGACNCGEMQNDPLDWSLDRLEEFFQISIAENPYPFSPVQDKWPYNYRHVGLNSHILIDPEEDSAASWSPFRLVNRPPGAARQNRATPVFPFQEQNGSAFFFPVRQQTRASSCFALQQENRAAAPSLLDQQIRSVSTFSLPQDRRPIRPFSNQLQSLLAATYPSYQPNRAATSSPPLLEIELTASEDDDDGSELELVLPAQHSKYMRVPTSSPKKSKAKQAKQKLKKFYHFFLCCIGK